MSKPKLIRITTVPVSLDKLLHGQLRFMNTFYEVVAISSDKTYLDSIGAREGVRTFPLLLSRKITPIADIIAVFKLLFFLRKEKPFIIHSHTPKAGLVAMLAAKLIGVPHRFHTVAGLPLLETTGVKRIVLDFVEKLTYACATKVYPNSFGLKDIILQNNYCVAHKLKVIANGSSNGIDTAYFNPSLYSEAQKLDLRNQLNIAKEDFVFIFVGRLVSDKGINELVAAFETLCQVQGEKNISNCKLLLVGNYEADLDPLLAKTIQIIQDSTAIITVGFQPDVRLYFSISNALVFPSYREGFPNVVMQAGSMGLPSIVTNINGCNEIIQEGINGTIIPVKNVAAIASKMTALKEDTAYYSSLQSKARTMITSRYDQKVIWNALHDEYILLSNGM